MATSPSYWGDFSDRYMPTLATVSDYIASARVLLQDLVPTYRYDDSSLVTALNVTLLEARRLRADLFIFNLQVRGQTQAFIAVDDTFVDIEPQFRLAILHGLCGHALERDQEDYMDARVASFLQMFYVGLIGRALPGTAGGSGPGRQAQGQGQGSA
jgi:hypothetical protein